ncbi:MAG: hypothetical protein RIC19_24360 [Phaeodactylibacter sp.]|uniref:hypothetical protein n=1 Tax=Phaeodactylibacter sp. TaxID=1940289 RepID=UPI0032F086D8
MITLLVVLTGAVLLARGLKNFMPGDKRLFQDLQQLKESMQEWKPELVPISSEELDTFSFNQEQRSVRKRFGKTAKGVFTTIYHEPILAYAYKEYSGPGHKAVLFAETREKSYSFIKDKKGVRIAAGQRQLGTLKEDGKLYSPKGGKAIATLGQSANQLLPVRTADRELGSLVDKPAAQNDELGQRAFQFVPNDLAEEEKDVFLALATLELVHRSLKS